METFIVTKDTAAYNHPGLAHTIDPQGYSITVPTSWGNYAHEYPPYLTASHILGLAGGQANVFIDFSLESGFKYLLAHQLLSSGSIAISFFTDLIPEKLHLEQDNGLFKNLAVKVLISADMLKVATGADEEKVRYNKLFFDDFSFSGYVGGFRRTLVYDRHQATNEWAAVQLLLNHGETLSAVRAVFDFPQTVLFSQGLKERGIVETVAVNLSPTSHYPQIVAERSKLAGRLAGLSKILLVDDNADHGWGLAIKKLFPGKQVDTKNSVNSAKTLTFKDYDLILLDLRLPLNDGEVNKPIENGLDLMEFIKKDRACLHVPIIAFTASQKATTMDIVQQKGGDAIYIKEPIDMPVGKSVENYLVLLSLINKQLDKGEMLKKYNKAIISVKSSYLGEIADTLGLRLKSRISERLEMFYGLLKKSFEETDYDRNMFHFSAESLAFMTLWSLLNEIQECFYEKSKGTSRVNVGSGTLMSDNDWKIKNTTDKYFLLHARTVAETIDAGGRRVLPRGGPKNVGYSSLVYQPAASPPYALGNYKAAFSYHQKISFQIAYLLLASPHFLSATKKKQYLGLLKRVNDFRNHLYLVHGENTAGSFHRQLEAQKPMNMPLMADFFGLIAFLLTGDENLA